MTDPILSALLSSLDDKRGVALVTVISASGPFQASQGRRALVWRDQPALGDLGPVSYTHLRAHETVLDLVCRLLLEKKNKYIPT